MSDALSSIPDPLPLVGRSSELSDLAGLLNGEKNGTSLVFLRGAGGVGKSRLARELATIATDRSWRLATGRAYPVESGVPYALFADAWLPLLRDMDESRLQRLTRGGAREIKYLFPALGPAEEDVEGFTEDPEEFRTRLMWFFSELVRGLTKESPLLCVLEDLQWADESSVQLLHYLSRQVVGQDVLIIVTYNEELRDQHPGLIEAEMSLSRLDVAEVMMLQPLTREHVVELVQRTFDTDASAIREFAAVLYGWTQGNPFFAEEIVKSLVSSGRIRRQGDTWVGWDAKEFGMPGTVRDAVLQRVRTLGEPAREIATIAAVIGAKAGYALLEAISGLNSDTLLTALGELCTFRVLAEAEESGEVVYHFVHPLVRDILYKELSRAKAQLMHGEVADAMERLYGRSAVQHADELAFHYSRTSGGQLRAKAAHYLELAGRNALERRADLEAVRYLESARRRVAELPEGEGPDDSSLALALARACVHLGRFDDAAAATKSALARLEPAHSAPAHRSLGMIHFWRGDHDAAHRHFELGLRAAEAQGADYDTVRLLVAKAYCLHEVGSGAESLETIMPALPIAEELGEPRLLARVHRALTLLHVWLGAPDKAQEHGQRAIELAEQVGDATIEFWARWGLAVLSGMRGDTKGMESAIEQIHELAEGAQAEVLKVWTADMRIELHFARGEWDVGIVEGMNAIATARWLNQRTLLPRILGWTSRFFTARGDLEKAGELVREAEEISGLGGDGPHDVHLVVPTYIVKAYYLVGCEDFEGAIAAAEKGLEIAERTRYILWALHLLLPILAEACFWANHVERAAEVGRRIRAHAEKIDHKLGLAWSDAGEALVRWKTGDEEGSIEPMRAAVAGFEAIPMVWEAARLRRQLSARLRNVGRLDEAKQELDRAWDVLVKLGAEPEIAKAEADYRSLGLKPPHRPDRRAPGDEEPEIVSRLTTEELAVAKLAAVGMSNTEIARTRDSAVRTISTHTSNIYKKLGLLGSAHQKRMMLGQLVREAGLIE